jgi:hypothetical protein
LLYVDDTVSGFLAIARENADLELWACDHEGWLTMQAQATLV